MSYEELLLSYHSSIAAYASLNDWKQELQPYTFRIEEMADNIKTPITIVKKSSGTSELTWKTKW